MNTERTVVVKNPFGGWGNRQVVKIQNTKQPKVAIVKNPYRKCKKHLLGDLSIFPMDVIVFIMSWLVGVDQKIQALKKRMETKKIFYKHINHYWLISFSFTCRSARQIVDIFRRKTFGNDAVENGRKLFVPILSEDKIKSDNFRNMIQWSSHFIHELISRHINTVDMPVGQITISFNQKFSFELYAYPIRKDSFTWFLTTDKKTIPEDREYKSVLTVRSEKVWKCQLRQLVKWFVSEKKQEIRRKRYYDEPAHDIEQEKPFLLRKIKDKILINGCVVKDLVLDFNQKKLNIIYEQVR